MKKNNYDKLLLSAYIDGELSQAEKKYIEEKIKSSLELQKELADLKKLKDITSSSIDRISDSPFFETRLFANLNSNSNEKRNFRKWIPAVSFSVITIALMLFLKFNPNLIDEVIEEQKTNIAGFYKENLQPLLYAANLTNEDIFNFAFNQELPLDSTNQQVLKLGYNEKGIEYFEIKKAMSVSEEDNFEKFVAALDLNDKEVEMIDSIIGSYSEQLSGMVLVNDKNSVAISPNIWNTRKAILADILSFAKKHAASDYYKMVPEAIAIADDKSVLAWVSESKSVKDDKYIFCTPDSIFREAFEFDYVAFNKEMENVSRELAEANKHLKKNAEFRFKIDTDITNDDNAKQWQKQFEVSVDTNLVKVFVQGIDKDIPDFPEFPEIDFPDFDSIAIIIREHTNNISTVSPRVPNVPDVKRRDNKKKFDVDVKTGNQKKRRNAGINLDSLMRQNNLIADSIHSEQMKMYEKKSKSDGTDLYYDNGLILEHNKELKKEMDELRKELKKFREDMNKTQTDSSKNRNIKKVILKPIEI